MQKKHSSIVSFQIIVLAVLVGLSTQVEYRPKFNMRGPSALALHRRQHLTADSVPHYTSKWPQRPPMRSRPIPVHMKHNKMPIGVPPPSRPIGIAPPVRNYYKTQQKKIKATIVKPHHNFKPEKTYLALPPITLHGQNFDHQIQSNVISTHSNPIQQVGEKGPIHTIPAPNLSLADRPNNIEIMRPQKSKIVGEFHQYQVTEPANEVSVLNQQNLYQADVQPQQQLYYMTDTINFQPQNLEVQQVQPNPKELLQILEQQQQPAYVQQFAFPGQNVVQQTPLFQPEVNYVQQVQANDKLSANPEFHSFNYDEQQHQKAQQSRRQTEYSAEAQQFNAALENAAVPQTNIVDPIAQASFIQKFFDTRTDEDENDVEPDAKPAPEEDTKQELLSSAYYSSLANQEAADTLATLQAAGKVNSNLMKMSQNVGGRNPMRIFVPDDSEETSEEHGVVMAKKVKPSEEFVDEEEEDGELEEEEYSQEDESFGHKLKPKRN